MVPLPQSLVNVIAFPLQLVAADLAVSSLQAFGMPVLREGNIIHLPQSSLFVAEACSGLRSLMALGTLGIVFAYFFRKSWLERSILIASTIPIAVIVNAFRVALTAVLTRRWGMEMTEGAVHMTEGFFTFGVAFGLLMLEASLISALLRGSRKTRKSPS
jgi:exosortase